MFVGRFGIGPDPLVKMYIHEYGLEGWGKEPIDAIAKYFCDIFNNIPDHLDDLIRPVEYIIAGAWIDEGTKKIDLKLYRDVKNWPGNPSLRVAYFIDGKFTLDGEICGDFDLATAEEEYFRRGEGYPIAPKNLDQFINSWPTSSKYKGLFVNYQNMVKF